MLLVFSTDDKYNLMLTLYLDSEPDRVYSVKFVICVTWFIFVVLLYNPSQMNNRPKAIINNKGTDASGYLKYCSKSNEHPLNNKHVLSYFFDFV